MELMELYNQIKNPISNPEVVEKLILAYSKSSQGFGGFYGQLTKTVEKEHTKGEHYADDADYFYSMMFNKWKNSIIALTREQFIELYKQGSYDQDFVKLREFLKKIPDVRTKKEANDIFFGHYNDKELEDALEKYRWTAFGGDSGWTHVCSRYVTAKQDKYPNIEHRLYLDTESLDTYKMINFFVQKCNQHQLPYYFKFDQYGNRDDTIVIYSSTEMLTQYVEILREIQKEHPDLISRAKEPPLLTGRIDNWIGYGSEPSRTPDGKNHSFNEIRSEAIGSAITNVTKKWIMNNRNIQIKYQGQQVSFQDYIAMKATESLIEGLAKRFSNYEDYDKKNAQNKGTAYDPMAVISKLGYSLQDVQSNGFKQSVFKAIKDKLGIDIQNVCNGSYKDMQDTVMNVRNGKQITFSGNDLRILFEQLSTNIMKNDPSFILEVQKEIINNSKKHGIDVDNFCFDTRIREKMIIIDAQNKSNIAQQTQSNNNKVGINSQQNESSNNIDLENLNVQSLPEIINSTLMQKPMKLPNGAVISAKQYIQEIIFPQLPSNGIIILSNGGTISAKQFIEECIMFECQEKYDGDFPRYMAENTRNNLNVVTVEYSNEKHEINPVEVVDFINPALLGKRTKLPNGVEISARQYIQEIYAPFIPSNGRVLLKSGATISVKQFIEEELLWDGQIKYNGDISQILYNMTMQNNGFLNMDPQKMDEELFKIRNQSSNGITR